MTRRSRWSWRQARETLRARELSRLSTLLTNLAPLDMRFVARTLWHTVLVGVSAGFIAQVSGPHETQTKLPVIVPRLHPTDITGSTDRARP